MICGDICLAGLIIFHFYYICDIVFHDRTQASHVVILRESFISLLFISFFQSKFSANELSNTVDEGGNTPLHAAAEHGRLGCLKKLVSHFPPNMITLPNDDLMTATALAVKVNKCSMIDNYSVKSNRNCQYIYSFWYRSGVTCSRSPSPRLRQSPSCHQLATDATCDNLIDRESNPLSRSRMQELLSLDHLGGAYYIFLIGL